MLKIFLTLGERLTEHWYRPVPVRPLLPLARLFGIGVRLRRWLYRQAWLPTCPLGVTVVVVGNLTVGGTGKTPLTLWLAQRLSERGWRVGLLTRGYRGQSRDWPQWVTPLSDPRQVGDEALLLAASGYPVVAGPDRVAGGRWLVARGCNLVLCDDGLQHYRLGRDREILVVDGERGFGNHCLLPAGPLREPVTRQAEVSLVVTQGDLQDRPAFTLALGDPVRMNDPTHTQPLTAFRGSAVIAVAGIGHPQRFFRQLQAAGLSLTTHAFPDHHPYSQKDFARLGDNPILMTEKDAVKCRAFADTRFWAVPARLEANPHLIQAVETLIGGAGSQTPIQAMLR